jgi:adenylate cyclase
MGFNSNPFEALGALISSLPGSPSKFTQKYLQDVLARGNRRVEVLKDRIEGIVAGRVMPDRDDVTIGSGRRFDLAILFLDICSFSARPNWMPEEQETILKIMNMFMAEMLSIVHDFEGVYEKNTGDGLMAYFGEKAGTPADKIKPAVEAALVMHYVNDRYLTPWFENEGFAPITFRIGIDYGPVTIARVGIHGDKSSLVAVGTAANIASKLMNRIPNGGVCIGETIRANLPHNWAGTCRKCDENSGFIYVQTGLPYAAWELNHRLTNPIF